MYRKDKLKNSIMELAAKFIEKESPPNTLVTVTNCDISKKFDYATILITVLPDEKETEIIKYFEKKIGTFRKYISENLKIRAVPALKIQIDIGEKNRQRIEELSRKG